MSDTYEPRDGDLVNMTFQTRVGSEAYRLALCNQVAIERVQPVDDPSKDPVGTVRLSSRNRGGVWVKREERVGHGGLWAYVCGHYGQMHSVIKDIDVVGWEVIGAVPGTPAAEKQAEQERPLWTGDGSEEPPAHVKKVRDSEGWIAVRQGSKWRYAETDNGRRLGDTSTYPFDELDDAPFTEVRD